MKVADATAARAEAKPESGGGRATLLTVAEVDGEFVNRSIKVAGPTSA